MTVQEYKQAMLSRQAKPASKYGAKREGGFDSQRERRRYQQLLLMERAGQISNLRRQVRFELIPSQRAPDGALLERPCSYVADFVYDNPDGSTTVEDAKGFQTKEYIIKRKLMLRVHGIRIVQS